MWGDLTVWTGSKEVVVARWWYRLWRWVTRADSDAHYRYVAKLMAEDEIREKYFQLQKVMYGSDPTAEGNRGRQRNSTANLREIK